MQNNYLTSPRLTTLLDTSSIMYSISKCDRGIFETSNSTDCVRTSITSTNGQLPTSSIMPHTCHLFFANHTYPSMTSGRLSSEMVDVRQLDGPQLQPQQPHAARNIDVPTATRG